MSPGAPGGADGAQSDEAGETSALGTPTATQPEAPTPSTATRIDGQPPGRRADRRHADRRHADRRRADRRRDRTSRALAGLLLALLAWFGQRAANGTGAHSWNSGRPPTTVHLTAGRQYDVSSRDGLRLLTARQGTNDVKLSCRYTAGDGASGDLQVTPGSNDPRVLHRLGTFTAPVTGRVAVSCTDTGAVWVDSADNAAFDTSGALVLLTVVLALAGGLLALRDVSADRPPTPEPTPGSAR